MAGIPQGHLRKKGSKWFYSIPVWDKTGTRKISRERAGTTDKAETRKLMQQAIHDYYGDGHLHEPSDMLLSAYLDEWFKECCEKELRHGTRRDYRTVINNHIKLNKIGLTPLKSLTPALIQEYIDEMVSDKTLPDGTIKPGLKPSTMKAHYAVLNRSLNYAVHPKKYITNNPFSYVRKTKSRKDVDVFFEEDEEQKVPDIITQEEFKQIEDFYENSFYQLPIQIAYYTGMRAGEVCALMWDDVDLKSKTIKITKSMFYNEELKSWELGKPKGGKARSLKIGDTLLAELKAARKGQIERRLEYAEYYKQAYYKKIQVGGQNHIQLSCPFRYEIANNPTQYKDQTKVDFVCAKTDGDLFTPQTIKYSNKAIKKQLNMPGYHFHMLRHTHGTILIANGAKMKAVQERLGHATITVTMDIYAHVTPEMEEETVGIFEKANKN